jgi:glycine reductase
VKELEREGIPTAHICSIIPVAQMVGSNRIVPVSSIVHPLGDPDLSAGAEKEMRRSVVEKALETLKEGV